MAKKIITKGTRVKHFHYGIFTVTEWRNSYYGPEVRVPCHTAWCHVEKKLVPVFVPAKDLEVL